MNLRSAKWIALLAVAGFEISTRFAQAAYTAPSSASSGELILGVRDTSGAVTNSNLIGIGMLPPSSGNIASALGVDLTALFNSNWYTDVSLAWSVIGYTGVGSGTRNTATGKIDNIYSQYSAGSDSGISGFTAGEVSANGLGIAVHNSEKPAPASVSWAWVWAAWSPCAAVSATTPKCMKNLEG